MDGGAIPSQGTTGKAAAIRTEHRSKHAVHWGGGSVRLSIVVNSTPSSSVAHCSHSETERKAIWSRFSVTGDRCECLGEEEKPTEWGTTHQHRVSEDRSHREQPAGAPGRFVTPDSIVTLIGRSRLPQRREFAWKNHGRSSGPYRGLVKRESTSPQTDSRESSPVVLSSIVLANQRCSRTATGELSLENPFKLIEGHPARLVISETSAC